MLTKENIKELIEKIEKEQNEKAKYYNDIKEFFNIMKEIHVSIKEIKKIYKYFFENGDGSKNIFVLRSLYSDNFFKLFDDGTLIKYELDGLKPRTINLKEIMKNEGLTQFILEEFKAVLEKFKE